MMSIWGHSIRAKRFQAARFGLALISGIVFVHCGSTQGPPPALQVVAVNDLGTIPTNPDILGRDGAVSAAFQGYSVWLYGDTFLANPNADGRGLISDSWSFTSDFNAQDGITGFQERLDPSCAPEMILPETSAEFEFNQAHNGNPCQMQPCGARWALWPASIVQDTVNNRALIFYMVVYSLPGSFNFQGEGNSVAIWSDISQQPQRPTFNPALVQDHPDLMFDQTQPNFGTTALMVGGTLYIYGCGIPNNSSDKGCRLAKVAPSNVLNSGAWNFYAGNGTWSAQLSDAVSVILDANILTVSWNEYLTQYVAVYSQLLSNEVMIRTAPNPEGPWSAERTIFTAMQPASGNIYDARAHSEYDLNGGETIFITYSRATGAFSSEVRLESVQLQRP